MMTKYLINKSYLNSKIPDDLTFSPEKKSLVLKTGISFFISDIWSIYF